MTVIHPVLTWREACSEPSPKEELQGQSKTVHNLRGHWDVLEVQDGVLYRLWENESGTVSKPLLVLL